jgi:DUF971 family protein
VDERTGVRTLDPQSIPEDIDIAGIEPVGNYAIRIKFDDLHDTGIYTWRYLYGLGKHADELFAAYLRALEERGLSREP